MVRRVCDNWEKKQLELLFIFGKMYSLVILGVYWNINLSSFCFGSPEIADRKTKKETERRTGREAVKIGTATEGSKTRIRNPGNLCASFYMWVPKPVGLVAR